MNNLDNMKLKLQTGVSCQFFSFKLFYQVFLSQWEFNEVSTWKVSVGEKKKQPRPTGSNAVSEVDQDRLLQLTATHIYWSSTVYKMLRETLVPVAPMKASLTEGHIDDACGLCRVQQQSMWTELREIRWQRSFWAARLCRDPCRWPHNSHLLPLSGAAPTGAPCLVWGD